MRFLVLSILLFMHFPTFAQHKIYRDYDVKEGLASATVYGIIQDRHGFMWFSTKNGASRFDGKTFKNFTRDDGLTDNTVLDIYEDSKGRIWFYTFNGLPCYYSKGKIYNAFNDPHLNSLSQRGIMHKPIEDKEGNLYFASNTHIYSYNEGEILSEGLSLLHNDSFVHEVHFSKITSIKPYGSRPYYYLTNDSFYFYTYKGVYHHSNGIYPVFNSQVLPNVSNVINQVQIGGEFWICTYDGAYRITGLNGGKPEIKTYLKSYKVADVFKDNEGNYWFSTLGNGVRFLASGNKNSLHVNECGSFPGGGFQATVLKRYKNGILAGTEKAVLVYLENGRCVSVPLTVNPMFNDPVYDIYVNENKDIIYAVTNSSFIKIDGDFNRQKVIGLHPEYVMKLDSSGTFPIYPNAVNYKAISMGPEDKLLLTTIMALFEYDESGNGKYVVPATIRIPGRNFTGYWGSNNMKWVGNSKGFSFISGDTLVHANPDGPLLYEPISDIAELEDGNLIIATRTRGILVFDGKKVVDSFDVSGGLTSSICNKIKLEGNIVWVATAGGVSKLKYENGRLSLLNTLTTSNGLLSNEVNDVISFNDNLYVATSAGITIFPDNQTATSMPPPLHILSAYAGGINLQSIENPVLGYNQNSVRFNFIGITYGEPEKMEYAYRLKGADNEWQSSFTGQVDYPALSPGKYIFEVKARKTNSNWSETINLPFVIKAPVWTQLWFQIFSLMGIAGLVSTGFMTWFRKRRMIREKNLSLQNRLIQLEQQALNALMNPHFIFNSLNSIQQFLLQNDPKAANKYLSLFARLTRTNMEVLLKGVVSLDDEIERLEMYLKLEKLRFGDKLKYSIDIADNLDTGELILPPMVLQPFVENAIWHGIMPKAQGGNLHLKVYYSEDGENYVIEIADDGIGMEKSKQIKKSRGIKHESRGMKIILERLELWTSQHQKNFKIELDEYSLAEDEPYGTIVKLILPVVNG